MFFVSLLSSLLLALVVSANPVVTIRSAPITLQISRSLNKTKTINLYRNDFNRAQALKAQGRGNMTKKVLSTPALDQALYSIARVGVGSPPTLYDLIVDTGSGLTWVGAGKNYVKTRSSTQTATTVSVGYSTGGMSGNLYIDDVTLASGVTVRQGMGVASTTRGIKGIGFNGILGLGPAALTIKNSTPKPKIPIASVTDNLFTTGMITENMVAISFQPSVAGKAIAGQLTWGGVDQSKLKGSITYVPITRNKPASRFWAITQTITYGRWFGKTIMSNAVGMVDTGTTLIEIAPDAFARYRAATGGTLDPATKLLTLTPVGFAKLKSLYFKIGRTTFEFTANAQIWPRALNTVLGVTPGKIYLVVTEIGRKSDESPDFINGHCWLQRFYTVYDTTNQRVGIANTPFTYAKTN